ncbi:12305_t:CDS:2, partial [Funneliformis mosseae]
MCQSVCYCIHQVQFSEILISNDGSFEPFFDKVKDSAKSFIKADEDWKLDLNDTYSSETITSNGQNDQNGEAKKAIQFAIQNDNEKLIQFIKDFNKKKEAQLIQVELIKQQKVLVDRKMNDHQ